jgi:phenylpropionate dioxygenase-like ring-hydroxylating dioxygenase large terminal subunit
MTFVRNTWYMAGWATEVEGGPVGRQILGEPVALFRTSAGACVALHDVCPHRAVPLSLGKVIEDHIQCPYHGLEFDGAGICRRNPHVRGPSDRLSVRAYPVAERFGMVWIWPGDPALADPSKIVDLGWFDSPDFTTCSGYLHIQADYRLLIDNLMDLAHAEYIHPNTVGSPGASAVQKVELVNRDGIVTVRTLLPNLPPTALFAKVWNRTERIDKYSDISWNFPSVLVLDLGVMAPGADRTSGFRAPSAHILTPETDGSTHYFWAFSRDFERDSPLISKQISETVARAFNEEDKPILEAAQRMIDMTGAKLSSFSIGDGGSAQVRRYLECAAEAEGDLPVRRPDARPGVLAPASQP